MSITPENGHGVKLCSSDTYGVHGQVASWRCIGVYLADLHLRISKKRDVPRLNAVTRNCQMDLFPFSRAKDVKREKLSYFLYLVFSWTLLHAL